MDLADKRIKEHFGLVTNDTSTTQFSFLISPPKNRETIEKHDVVCFNHPKYGEDCQVLAEVREITSYEEVAGSTIGERVGKMMATARIIGYIDLRNKAQPIRKLLAPPNPGSRIYMPYASFLEDALNRGSNGEAYSKPLCLGKTEIVAASTEASDLQVSCYLDAAELTSKHTLISATGGAGKTHLATVIVEEVANKTAHPIVILDPNSEYTKIGEASKQEKEYPFTFHTETVNADAKIPPDALVKKTRAQVTVFTAENMSLTEKSAYYTNILRALIESRRLNLTQPSLLVIEDAESLPQQVVQELLSSKIGVAAVLISSHPVALGGLVLSRMCYQMVGRTVDAEDLAFLKNATEGSDEQLSNLHLGEWIVNGLNVARPLKIHVRDRFSKPK